MKHLKFVDARNALQFMYLATGGWNWSPENGHGWLQEGLHIAHWTGCTYRKTAGDALPEHFEFLEIHCHEAIWKPILPIISHRLIEAVSQGQKTAHVVYKNPRNNESISYHYDLEKMTQTRDTDKSVHAIRAVGNGWQFHSPEKREVGLERLVVDEDLAFTGVLPARMFEPIGKTLRVVDFSCGLKPTKLRNGAVARPGMRVVAVTDMQHKSRWGVLDVKAGDKGAIMFSLVRFGHMSSFIK